MECFLSFSYAPPTTSILRRSVTRASKPNRNGWVRAKLHDDDDPLLRAAINAASLLFQETHRPEPLFVDPYAGCFVSPHIQMDMKKSLHPHCVATKFIDDKLLRTVNHIDGLKQVVLLSDGMDTRPYRLSWPTSTIIFDVSPERVFKRAAEGENSERDQRHYRSREAGGNQRVELHLVLLAEDREHVVLQRPAPGRQERPAQERPHHAGHHLPPQLRLRDAGVGPHQQRLSGDHQRQWRAGLQHPCGAHQLEA